MADPIDLALLGFGDVGQAVAERVAGDPRFRVVAATDTSGTLVDEQGLDAVRLVEVKRSEGELAASPVGQRTRLSDRQAAATVDADVAVQVTPSRLEEPEASLATLEAALDADKHAVTAAKDALACRPEALRQAAETSEGTWRASASVGASVPVLETVASGFVGDEVETIRAALNGSTTFVLSQMEGGATREQALARAREAGLLETDPTADLTGLDAAAKAAILHQHVYTSRLSLSEVDVTGIGHLDEATCRGAREDGFAIRLLAHIDEGGARVAPVEIPAESPLALEGPQCRVELVLRGAGSIGLSGPGAGPHETASAVVGDVLALGKPAEPGGEPCRVEPTV